jgi:DNA-binding transcriptional regulator GbsR (MarR family)
MKPIHHSFVDLKQGMIDHMSLAFEHEGFSPLVGKIFACLLFSAEPVSLQEMADQLGVTKAAVSVQVRALEKQLMCQKLPTSSDRKDYYYISEDFSMTAVQNSITKMRRVLQQIDATVQLFNQLEQVEREEQRAYEMSRRRFIEMKELHQMFLNRLDGLEEEWNERRDKLFSESE